MVIVDKGRWTRKPIPAQRVEVDWTHPLAKSLEALYLMQGPGGLVIDSARFKRNSVGITGARQVIQGGGKMAGAAYDFNANSDLIDVGTWGFDMSAGVTIEAWSYHDAFRAGVDERYVSKADGISTANHDWMLGNTVSGTRNLRCRIGRHADSTAIGATDISGRTGQWIHSIGVLVFDVLWVTRVYLDGVQDGQSISFTPNTAETADSVYIGNQPTSATSAPDGRIGLVAIWSRSLSPAEILWRFTEPFAFLRPVIRRTYVVVGGGAPAPESTGQPFHRRFWGIPGHVGYSIN